MISIIPPGAEGGGAGEGRWHRERQRMAEEVWCTIIRGCSRVKGQGVFAERGNGREKWRRSADIDERTEDKRTEGAEWIDALAQRCCASPPPLLTPRSIFKHSSA